MFPLSHLFQNDDQTISSETCNAVGCHFHSCQCFLSGLVSTQAAPMDTVVEHDAHSQLHALPKHLVRILSVVNQLTVAQGNNLVVVKQNHTHTLEVNLFK